MSGIRHTTNFKVRVTSLLVFWLCGVAGVLVDLDHPIAYYLLPELGGRFLHTPILIAGGLLLGGLGAYLAGLYFRLVLTRRKETPLSAEV